MVSPGSPLTTTWTVIEDVDTKDVETIRPDYLQMILQARVYDVARETPLHLAERISLRTQNQIFLKREDQQPVFSFKLRGAYNKMSSLAEAERQRGVITCSAGNHAQGVALAARELGIKATIVMPVSTPQIKVDNVRLLGAEALLHGSDYDAASDECKRLSKVNGWALIHPFDDPYVIAGNGTIGMEILRQIQSARKELKYVFVCVGGGGLIAGISYYIKQVAPHVKVIGVETDDANAMQVSLQVGRRVRLNKVGRFADGKAVKEVGKETFLLAKQYADGVITVTCDQVCAAIKDVFEDTRSILEPAGALAVAGCKQYIKEHGLTDAVCVAVCSGANMNFNTLRYVSEQAEIGQGKETMLAVTIPERNGACSALYDTISPANITEFVYRHSDLDSANVIVTVECNSEQKREMMARMQAGGFNVLDCTNNDIAKTHVRYMAGGRGIASSRERVFQFLFPEMVGALGHFLQCLSKDFSISLFHYRNLGSDVARVLCGIRVPQDKVETFQRFLDAVDYPYTEETNNSVYQQFLR